MRSGTSRFGVMAVMWMAALSGCGRVIVDAEATGDGGSGGQGGTDDGGSGGTGGSAETTTSTTSTSTTSTSTTSTTIDPDEVTPACKSYCEKVTQTKDCFELEDCHVRCMGFYVEGCTKEIEDMLDCVPPWLTEACQITYPDAGGCYGPFFALSDCAGEAFPSCQSSGSSLEEGTECSGYANCKEFDLDISCDSTGQCTCTKDGIEVGTCGMPFSGGEACSPAHNCCRAFL